MLFHTVLYGIQFCSPTLLCSMKQVLECMHIMTEKPSVLQTLKCNQDTLRIIFMCLHKHIHCDPSLEPPYREC